MKSLLLKTCINGKDEISEDKKKDLGYFLANSCTVEHSNDSIKRAILETLLKLSEFELFVLKVVHEKTKENWTRIPNYDPANQAWLFLSEKNIMESLREHNELNVISTLEYLNAIGVIENISSRNINIDLDEEVEDINLRNKIGVHEDKCLRD